jgi:hypothetical protein
MMADNFLKTYIRCKNVHIETVLVNAIWIGIVDKECRSRFYILCARGRISKRFEWPIADKMNDILRSL